MHFSGNLMRPLTYSSKQMLNSLNILLAYY